MCELEVQDCGLHGAGSFVYEQKEEYRANVRDHDGTYIL